jgi:N-acetylneuraminic acid mutarotase
MNKYLTFLFALLIFSCKDDEIVKDPVKDQSTWKKLNDFPGTPQSNGISFSVGGKGYTGLGHIDSFDREIWSFDPATDSWEQKNDFPFDLPGDVGLSTESSGYVMTYSGSLYEYQPLADAWTYRTSFPGEWRTNFTGFVINDNLYFGFGNDIEKSYKEFWKYNPAENVWSQVPDYPGIARSNAEAFVIDNKAFVGLGFNDSAPPILVDMYEYDPGANEWTQIADYPESNALCGIVFSNHSKGYIGTAENTDQHRGKVYEYDPQGRGWRLIKPFPSGSSLITLSFTINERMFVVGGWFEEHSTQVYEYIP